MNYINFVEVNFINMIYKNLVNQKLFLIFAVISMCFGCSNVAKAA